MYLGKPEFFREAMTKVLIYLILVILSVPLMIAAIAIWDLEHTFLPIRDLLPLMPGFSTYKAFYLMFGLLFVLCIHEGVLRLVINWLKRKCRE
jgi:hypothetical protein